MKCRNKAIFAGLVTGMAITGTAITVETIARTASATTEKCKRHKRIQTVRRKSAEESEEIKAIYREASAWLHREPSASVSIKSNDGLTLVGHWFPAEDAKRTLILAHGWHGRWDRDFAPFAPYFHTHQSNLLFIEQRGHGESGGKYITMGVLERLDVAAWAWYAASRTPKLPVYLCGISMGAASVCMAANLPMPDNVSGILSDCGFTSPQAIIRLFLKQRGKFASAVLMKLVNVRQQHRASFRYDQVSAVDALSQTMLPVLFVHGTADHFVPSYMTEVCYAVCASEKELFLVQGAGHTRSFLTDPAGYRSRLAAFFAHNDSRFADQTLHRVCSSLQTKNQETEENNKNE